jgi:hypothetical protein
MADDRRRLDAELSERRMQQLRLRRRCPEAIAGPAAMAEARPVERENAVMASQAIEQAARLEIALRHGIAVDQDDGRALASLDDMKADAVDVEQAAGGRLFALGAP